MNKTFTPGPWQWLVNPKSHSVELVTPRNMGSIILEARRWGMGGATLMFNVGGILKPAIELSEPIPGREHHASWARLIVHPDAQLIEAAPDLLSQAKLFKNTLEVFIEFENSRQTRDHELIEQLNTNYFALMAVIAKATGGPQ